MSSKRITVTAPAKINLGLAITGRRSDGFHDLISVFQTVSWSDELEFSQADDISLSCSDTDLPIGPDNLVWRASELVRKHFGIQSGARIHLRKSIPWGAGLGGGSSDAAATLLGLAKLWDIEADESIWLGLCAELGSDVPFFLRGGTAVVTGRGEHVEPLLVKRNSAPLTFVVAVPPISVSTPWAFRTLASHFAGEYPNASEYRESVDALRNGTMTLRAFCEQLTGWNTFQPIVESHHPEIAEVRHRLTDAGAIVALMSGSGSAVFGAFDTVSKADSALASLDTRVRAMRVDAIPAVRTP